MSTIRITSANQPTIHVDTRTYARTHAQRAQDRAFPRTPTSAMVEEVPDGCVRATDDRVDATPGNPTRAKRQNKSAHRPRRANPRTGTGGATVHILPTGTDPRTR